MLAGDNPPRHLLLSIKLQKPCQKYNNRTWQLFKSFYIINISRLRGYDIV